MKLKKRFLSKGLNLFELCAVVFIFVVLLLVLLPRFQGEEMRNFSRNVNTEINNTIWKVKRLYCKIMGYPWYTYCEGDIIRVKQ